MAVSSKGQSRRSRYQRERAQAPAALSLRTLQIAVLIAEFRVLTSTQLVRLTGLPSKTVLRETRKLFDFGTIKIIPVPRAALANPGDANDPSLIYGSAPNIMTMTAKGMRLLQETGLLDNAPNIPAYDPTSSLLLRHQLLIGDVHIWFRRSAQASGTALVTWKEGAEAQIPLGTEPAKSLRPDAVAILRLSAQSVLVALLEADRGTERGTTRWVEKLTAYEAAFTSNRLKAATGFQNARIVVVTLSELRRDRLLKLITEHASPSLQARIWIVEQSALDLDGLSLSVWRQPGSAIKKPLIRSSNS